MTEPSSIFTASNAHVTFGILTDVQYADIDEGANFSKTRTRYYRNSLELLKNAVQAWTVSKGSVAFILQLGDLIDGENKKGGDDVVQKALRQVLHQFECISAPIYHLIGNHELYNMNRSFLLTSPLNSTVLCNDNKHADTFYYTFNAHPKLRIVALDTYELGLLGYDDRPDDEHFILAQSLMHINNKNENSKDVTGLEGFEQRWASYNGGIGEKQMLWLSKVLKKAQSSAENVIIISHVPLRCSLRDVCLAWNYEEILATINKYNCVIAIFAGHDHMGWDMVDDAGIQHITFQAILETAPGGNAYATAHLWDRTLTVTGVGRIPSFTVPLRFPVD